MLLNAAMKTIVAICILFVVSVSVAHADCKLEISPGSQLDNVEFRHLKDRMDQFKKAYQLGSVEQIEAAQGYPFSPGQSERFSSLKDERFTGVRKVCLQKMSSGTDGYFAVVRGNVRYKDGKPAEDIHFYISKATDGKFTFSELLFSDIDLFELPGVPNEIGSDQP